MIKVAAPNVLSQVADRAMQTWGAMGLSPDTPLADLYTAGRVLRLADGPDEVHLQSVARQELKAQQEQLDRVSVYLDGA